MMNRNILSTDDDTSDDSETSSESSMDISNIHCCEALSPEIKRLKKDNIDKNFNQSESSYSFVIKGIYKWVIKDFNVKYTQMKKGERIESDPFVIGCDDDFEFQLFLYPKGDCEQHKKYLVAALHLLSCKESQVMVKYRYNIVNYVKEDKMQEAPDVTVGQSFGYKRLIKIEFMNKEYGFSFLENNKLILKCDILAHLSKKNTSNKLKVVNDLEFLLDSGKYSDVTLEVENTKFKAHKYILAARSSFFDAMFSHDMKEKNANVIKLTDDKAEVLKELLQYIYTGEVKNMKILAKDLLVAAEKYNFKDLKALCENEVYKSLNVDNVVEILNFAETHNSAKLKEQALIFFVDNVKDAINTQEFKIISNQSPLLAQIICLMAKRIT